MAKRNIKVGSAEDKLQHAVVKGSALTALRKKKTGKK
jgi:hypothetical protein